VALQACKVRWGTLATLSSRANGAARWVGETVTTDASHNNTEGGDARRLADGDNSDADRQRRSIDDKEAYARPFSNLFRKYEVAKNREYFTSSTVGNIISERSVAQNRRKNLESAKIRGVESTYQQSNMASSSL